MDVNAEAAGPGAVSSRETEAQRPSRGGGGGGGGRTSSTTSDAFAADASRGLVRCLCGVVMGRWKQASSTTAKVPKKVWVLHAMEAVHALVRTLEVSYIRPLVYRRRRGKTGGVEKGRPIVPFVRSVLFFFLRQTNRW